MSERTREEHLQWCKARALAYLEPGPHFSISDAIVSMGSDLNTHEATRGHSGATLGLMLLMSGHLSTVEAAREHINGFN